MDSKCLRLSTSQRNGFLLCLLYSNSIGVVYDGNHNNRIGAGCCSIITTQVFQSLRINNRQ